LTNQVTIAFYETVYNAGAAISPVQPVEVRPDGDQISHFYATGDSLRSNMPPGVASCAGTFSLLQNGRCIPYLWLPFNELVNVDLANSKHILLQSCLGASWSRSKPIRRQFTDYGLDLKTLLRKGQGLRHFPVLLL